MNIAKSPGLLLGALKEHEQTIAHLYKAYAEKFSEWKDFWIKLSSEEIQHARWLDTLQARVEDSSEDFVVDRFPIEAIEHSLVYMKRLIAQALESDFTLINALSTALQIEKALIENQYFEVFEGDSAKTRQTLTLLAQSTQIHCEKLYKVWKEHGCG